MIADPHIMSEAGRMGEVGATEVHVLYTPIRGGFPCCRPVKSAIIDIRDILLWYLIVGIQIRVRGVLK